MTYLLSDKFYQIKNLEESTVLNRKDKIRKITVTSPPPRNGFFPRIFVDTSIAAKNDIRIANVSTFMWELQSDDGEILSTQNIEDYDEYTRKHFFSGERDCWDEMMNASIRGLPIFPFKDSTTSKINIVLRRSYIKNIRRIIITGGSNLSVVYKSKTITFPESSKKSMISLTGVNDNEVTVRYEGLVPVRKTTDDIRALFAI